MHGVTVRALREKTLCQKGECNVVVENEELAVVWENVEFASRMLG